MFVPKPSASLALLSSLTLLGCVGEISNEPGVPTERAYLEETGSVEELYVGDRAVYIEELHGQFIFEGDILLAPETVSREPLEASAGASIQSTGRTAASQVWPDGVVHYAIDPALPNQARVIDAIAEWEANSGLRFVLRGTESDYVYFVPGGGCSSYVGRVGGRQNITLATACSTGNTVHEIGHAVGLWHEHSRADRDGYVTVHFENIASGAEHNFYTYLESGYDGAEYTATLDFDSIMMYSSYSFSANGQPTITTVDGSTYSAQRSGLSLGDIEGISTVYPSLDGGAGGGGGTPVETLPLAPSNLASAATSDTRITLSWADNADNEQGFAIERSLDGTSFAQIASVAGNTSSFSNTGLEPATQYSYRLRAFNSVGSSEYTNIATSTTDAPLAPLEAPSAPNDLSATLSGSSVNVAWTDTATNEQGYTVAREKLAQNGSWSGLTVVAQLSSNATSYQDNAGRGTYRYRVQAFNSGGASSWSISDSVTVIGGKGRKR